MYPCGQEAAGGGGVGSGSTAAEYCHDSELTTQGIANNLKGEFLATHFGGHTAAAHSHVATTPPPIYATSSLCLLLLSSSSSSSSTTTTTRTVGISPVAGIWLYSSCTQHLFHLKVIHINLNNNAPYNKQSRLLMTIFIGRMMLLWCNFVADACCCICC